MPLSSLKMPPSLLIAATTMAAVTSTTNAYVCDFTQDAGAIFAGDMPEIFSPSDSGYGSAIQQFGGLYGTTQDGADALSPDWIVRPTTEEQISELVTYLNDCKEEDGHPFAVNVRSGGHSYSGLSSCHATLSPGYCFQIDMRNFKQFELLHQNNDPSLPVEYIRMQPGLTVREIGELTSSTSIFVPHGVCQEVGIGGHYQTSALGHWARTVGLGIDNVASIRIVLADGTIKTVSKDDPEDCDAISGRGSNSLYWSILGGNAGSWGVITEVKLDASRLQNAHYPNAELIVYDWKYSKSNLEALMGVFLDLTKNPAYFNERDAWPYFLVQPDADAGNPFLNFKITLFLAWSGSGFEGSLRDSGRYDTLVQPFLDAVPAEDLLPRQLEIPGPPSLVAFFGTATTPPFRFYSNQGGSQNPFNKNKWIGEVTDLLDEAVNHPAISLLFQLVEYGGAVVDNANTPWSLNAFPHRNMKHVIDNWIWFPSDEAAPVALDLKERFDAVLGTEKRPTLWGASGVGNGSVDMCQDYRDYYQNNAIFQRLQDVKNCVDPKNLFRNYFTIPTNC